MKQVLQESVIYPYLQPNATNLLVQARTFAKETGLLESNILQCGEKSFFIAPWVGTKEIRTIAKLLSCGLKDQLDIYSVASSRYYLQVTTGLRPEEFLEKFKELNISLNDPDVILPKDQTPKVDKYDSMVPESLLRSAFLHNQMCVPDAIGIVNNLIIES